MTRDSKSKTRRLTAGTARDLFDGGTQCKVCIWVCITQWYNAPRSTDNRRLSTTTTTRDLDVSTRSSFLAELSREPLVNLEIGGGDGGSRAEEHFAKIVG